MRAIIKQSLIDALIACALVVVLEAVLFPAPRPQDVVYIILGDDSEPEPVVDGE